MADETGTTTYAYDDFGNLTTETNGDIVKTSTYDVMGNRIGFTVTKGGTAILTNTYTYDATGKMLSVTSNGQTVNYTYDANGNLLSETGNNHGVTNTYNKSNMLTVKQNTSGGTLCNNYSITRDYAGNATKVTDSLAGYDRRYNYDLFGRLYYETTSHNREGESEFDMEYMFDRFGNRYCELKTMHNSDDVYYREYEYGQYNQLTTIITEAISDTFVPYTISYSYDGNGNLSGSTKTIEPDEVIENKTYTFNNAGRMTQSTKDGVTTTYTYNGDGLRMSKTTNGVTTSFILDGADVVAEIKGDEITVYSRGLGLISQTKGDTTKTYFSDDHGNVTGMYSSATDGEEALYDGFGNTLFNDSSDNPFGYCGEYYDEETGLIYLRARYYDPETGRFISEDPHWNTDNMIYGDEPQIIKVVAYPKDYGMIDLNIEHYSQNNDFAINKENVLYINAKCSCQLGLNIKLNNNLTVFINDLQENLFNMQGDNATCFYSVYDVIIPPDISAITQASNLYVYAVNNPILYIDPSGEGAKDVFKSMLSGAITGGLGGACAGGSASLGTLTVPSWVAGAVVGGVCGLIDGLINEMF